MRRAFSDWLPRQRWLCVILKAKKIYLWLVIRVLLFWARLVRKVEAVFPWIRSTEWKYFSYLIIKCKQSVYLSEATRPGPGPESKHSEDGKVAGVRSSAVHLWHAEQRIERWSKMWKVKTIIPAQPAPGVSHITHQVVMQTIVSI